MTKYKEKYVEARKEIEKLKQELKDRTTIRIEVADDDYLKNNREEILNCEHEFDECEITKSQDILHVYFTCSKCGFKTYHCAGETVNPRHLAPGELTKLLQEGEIALT